MRLSIYGYILTLFAILAIRRNFQTEIHKIFKYRFAFLSREISKFLSKKLQKIKFLFSETCEEFETNLYRRGSEYESIQYSTWL